MGNLDGKMHDLIERHLMDRLSVEEAERFTQLMNDPEFRKEVELKKDILTTIEHVEDARLKAMLQHEESVITSSSTKLFSLKRIAAVAATILFLIFIYWQFFPPKAFDPIADYFVPEMNTLYPTNKSGDEPTDVEQIFNLYDQKKYTEALSGFEKILAEESNDDIAFYQANAMMATGKITEAIPILENIIQNQQTDYLSSAKWNLALAYAHQKNYPAAKTILNELKEDRFYKTKAEQLLKESVFNE